MNVLMYKSLKIFSSVPNIYCTALPHNTVQNVNIHTGEIEIAKHSNNKNIHNHVQCIVMNVLIYTTYKSFLQYITNISIYRRDI